jgi:hypothetical protein
MNRAAFTGRQLDRRERWRSICSPAEQPKWYHRQSAEPNTINGASGLLAGASGGGMPLRSIPGRKPRNGERPILVAKSGDRGAEHVADAPHRSNQRRAVRPVVKLLAQSRDHCIDRTIEIRPFASAQRAEQSGARHRLARLAQKDNQQIELR